MLNLSFHLFNLYISIFRTEDPASADLQPLKQQKLLSGNKDKLLNIDTFLFSSCLSNPVKDDEVLMDENLNVTNYSPDFAIEEPDVNDFPHKPLKKSMRSMSRSTFDSVIDDFIEDDWEKKSAFCVSLTVVSILTTFLVLLFLALSISLGVQHGHQSKKLAFIICSKVSNIKQIIHW